MDVNEILAVLTPAERQEFDEHLKALTPGPIADSAYQNDPIKWMVERMGVREETLRWSMLPEYENHQWDGTKDPLIAIADALVAGKDVGVESGTGTGKTRFGALLLQWYLAVHRDGLVVTLAPKGDQLRLHIWKEIGRDWQQFSKRFPQAQLLDLGLRMRGDEQDKQSWAAVGFPVGVEAGAESATKAQGFHADRLLFVFEETPGIPKAVMTAVENTCTGDNNQRLAFGNPDHQQDSLHEFCTSPGTVHVRISAYDHPNVVCGRDIIPGAVTRKAIERRSAKYGRSGRLFQSRVRGISPQESASALIRWAWCQQSLAYATTPSFREGPKALGVDVANSEAGDKAAIARGVGKVLLEVQDFQCPNANQLGRDVLAEARASMIPAELVGVDSVGVGAGTVNVLHDADFWVQTLNGGAKPAENGDAERFLNLRSQQHWQMREDLQHARIVLPDDSELWEDLTMPTWETRNGKIVVESKEDIKKRLGRSPNKGDAAILWNWVRHRFIQDVKPVDKYGDMESMAIAERNSDTLEPWEQDRHHNEPDYGYHIVND